MPEFFFKTRFPRKFILCFTTMPAKRTYGSLTGGTGDVNPQTYYLQIPFAAVTQGVPTDSAHTARAFPLPVPKFSASLNKSVVVELLGVAWELDNPGVPNESGTSVQYMFSVSTSPYPTGTKGTWASFVANSASLSLFRRQIGYVSFQGNNTQADPLLNYSGAGYGSQIYNFDLSEYDDLTDQAGHGLLVATDNIYLNAWVDSEGSTTSRSNPAAVATLHYRLKEIGLQEYIGIVQSQQQAPAFTQ